MNRVAALLLAIATVASLAACGPLQLSNPMEPSLPIAYGMRVTDGKLKIWTGAPCVGTRQVSLTFGFGRGDGATFALANPARSSGSKAPDPGVDVEYITVGDGLPGLPVFEPLPAGYDWRTAVDVMPSIEGPPTTWGISAELADAVRDSAQHPDDVYYYEGFGWLDPADVEERDGKDFNTVCTIK